MQIKENVELDRDKVIIRTSIVGIITNLFLVTFKIVVGILSNSIAVILDAVNNLSDALSSVITIVGNKLSNKLPDKNHPLGYGRIEYLSAMAVSGIVLYAGLTALIKSIESIITPEEVNYSVNSLIIISVAVFVKIILGSYVKSQGKKVNSQALVASGSDAMFDAILSFSVLATALIYVVTHKSLEAYVGVVISLFITKSGFGMLKETIDDILGKRSDKELTKKIKSILASEKAVHGAFDLFLYNYGPNKNYGSVHLELPDTMTIEEMDQITRRLEKKVYRDTGVILTGIGAYSYNTKDDAAAHIRNDIIKIVMQNDFAMQMHGFYVDVEKKDVRFDVVVTFDIGSKEALEIIYKQLEDSHPDYKFTINIDVDVSD